MNIEVRPGKVLDRVPQGDDVALLFLQRKVQEVATGDIVPLSAGRLACRRGNVTSGNFPMTLSEFEKETVGTSYFKQISAKRMLKERLYPGLEVLLQRRFVLKVIQIFVSKEIVPLIELLQVLGGELCVRKYETAGRALQNPRVQKMIGCIASAEDAKWCRQRSVWDEIIVGRQCSGSL